MSALLQLAQRFARLRHASVVISSREDGDKIIFVLESGQKYTFTRAELETAVTKFAEDKTPPANDKKRDAKKADKHG